MRFAKSFYGSSPLVGTFKTSAALVAGQPCLWVAAATGTVTDPTTTACVDCFGVTTSVGAYSTTQGSEGTAEVIYDPHAVFLCRIVPSATAGTAYAADDGYYLTETAGDATGLTITDSDTGGTTADMNDGYVFAVTGANVGESRVQTTHTAATSTVVTVPFSNAIAIGDDFVASQYAPGVKKVQLTSDFTQANGTIAGGTGAEFVVVDVIVDIDSLGTPAAPVLQAYIQSYAHVFNKLA
jgi:hypothetical protein